MGCHKASCIVHIKIFNVQAVLCPLQAHSINVYSDIFRSVGTCDFSQSSGSLLDIHEMLDLFLKLETPESQDGSPLIPQVTGYLMSLQYCT